MTETKGVRNDPRCKVHTWKYNGVQYYDFTTGGTDDSYTKNTTRSSKLKSGLLSLPFETPINVDCFLDNTIILDWTLRDALK